MRTYILFTAVLLALLGSPARADVKILAWNVHDFCDNQTRETSIDEVDEREGCLSLDKIRQKAIKGIAAQVSLADIDILCMTEVDSKKVHSLAWWLRNIHRYESGKVNTEIPSHKWRCKLIENRNNANESSAGAVRDDDIVILYRYDRMRCTGAGLVESARHPGGRAPLHFTFELEEFDGRTLDVIVVHAKSIDYKDPAGVNEKQEHHYTRLRDYCVDLLNEDASRTVLICGDWNNPWYETGELFDPKPVFHGIGFVHIGPALGIRTYNNQSALDHAVIGGNWDGLGYGCEILGDDFIEFAWSCFSDHLPVWISISEL